MWTLRIFPSNPSGRRFPSFGSHPLVHALISLLWYFVLQTFTSLACLDSSCLLILGRPLGLPRFPLHRRVHLALVIPAQLTEVFPFRVWFSSCQSSSFINCLNKSPRSDCLLSQSMSIWKSLHFTFTLKGKLAEGPILIVFLILLKLLFHWHLLGADDKLASGRMSFVCR